MKSTISSFKFSYFQAALCFTIVVTLSLPPMFAEQKQKKNGPVILDYMGKSNGEKILPEWVADVLSDPSSKFKTARKSLRLKDTDHIWILEENKDSFDNLLLKGKILVYANFIETVMLKISGERLTGDYENVLEKNLGLSSLGCWKVVSESYSDKIMQTETEVANYITPFGMMQSCLQYDSATDCTSRIENVLEMFETQNGHLVCPLEYEEFFKWFRNEENVKINQFWNKVQMPDKSIKYNCLTLMAMSKKDYDTILQWSWEQLQEGDEEKVESLLEKLLEIKSIE